MVREDFLLKTLVDGVINATVCLQSWLQFSPPLAIAIAIVAISTNCTIAIFTSDPQNHRIAGPQGQLLLQQQEGLSSSASPEAAA